MEPVRSKVDAFVLDWISREPLHREWFFEQRDGNCRLMGPFAARLSETIATWRSVLSHRCGVDCSRTLDFDSEAVSKGFTLYEIDAS